MNASIRFCLVLHNHQPIGNFDHVFQQAYYDSYLPFLEVFEPFQHLRISLHTSGPLMEWLDQHHPEYLERLAALVQAGRVEIIGGPFYEPILTMIPSADRVGQISLYTDWLENRFGGQIRGMWMPERVWEQSLTSDLAAAKIDYTVLDDFHFRNAGLRQQQLHGYYVTEDDGNLLSIFPGSERLRYLIPFGHPQQSVDYLREVAESDPGAVVVFGDDGEKFGTWPETKQHVYDNGWLNEFFHALTANQDWLDTTTLADAIDHVSPVGKTYLPDASYREMTEWALPANQQMEYESLAHEFEHDSRWPQLRQFVRGGFWRNFKVKYSEANEMYARMMMVSRRVQQAIQNGYAGQELEEAQREVYRGQCNCSYWHGAFGGIYLPHLRNAVYQHLIAADNLLDKSTDRAAPWLEVVAGDFNFDARQEVRMTNDRLMCLLAPAQGGQLYEMDVRSICHNLLATMTRRPEAYHRKILAGANQSDAEIASIHDRVVFKQEGLDQQLQYDDYARNSLIDHFYDTDASLEGVSQGNRPERGDFVLGVYEAKLRRNPDRVQVQLSREGSVGDIPLKITKAVTMQAGTSSLDVSYQLEGLPQDRPLHFAIEWNFAGMPSGADDRYFYRIDEDQLGHLGSCLNLQEVQDLGLIDQWLGVDVRWSADRPSGVWTFPVQTVSQSEGGFELVHQSVVVMPHWLAQGDQQGRWSVNMTLWVDTSIAESRMQNAVAVGSQ